MIEKRPSAFRHELKHLISPAESRILSERLGRLFPRDSHAGPDGMYRVNSLYFDTPDDKALCQKISGVDQREKFRLRYYGQEPRFLRMEKKIKKGGLCSKSSARLTYEQAEKLLAGEIDFLLESGDPLLIELYSKMRGELSASQNDRKLRPGSLYLCSGKCADHTGQQAWYISLLFPVPASPGVPPGNGLRGYSS